MWKLSPEAVEALDLYSPDARYRRRRFVGGSQVGTLVPFPPALDPPGGVAHWWWDPFTFPRRPRTADEARWMRHTLRDALCRRLALTITLRQRGQLRSRPGSRRAEREWKLLIRLERELAEEAAAPPPTRTSTRMGWRAAASGDQSSGAGTESAEERGRGREGRPIAAVHDPGWLPVAAETADAVWVRPARGRAGHGRLGGPRAGRAARRRMEASKPALHLYAPREAVRSALKKALSVGWDVRVVPSLADLVAPWRGPTWPRLDGSAEALPAPPGVPLVYAPDGSEHTRADVWDDPNRGPPPAGQAARTLHAWDVLGRALLARPCVVYATSAAAIESVPRGVAGLPARPVFDARREWIPDAAGAAEKGERRAESTADSQADVEGAWTSVRPGDPREHEGEIEHRAAHWAAVRAAVGRAAADDVAHRAWHCVMQWADAHLVVEGAEVAGRRYGVALGSLRLPGMRWPPVPPGLWPPRARRTADALRRLFLRPEAFPDAETLATTVGLDAWVLERWAARLWLAPLKTVRDVLLAFHAMAALWDCQAAPRDVAAALRLDSGRPTALVLLLRGCAGMPPAAVRKYGVAVGPDALLDALLARRPSATSAYGDGVAFWEALLGTAPPPLPLPAVYLAPDGGRLPPRYADLPRFVANVLPAWRDRPGGHPYAHVNPVRRSEPTEVPPPPGVSAPAEEPAPKEPAPVDGSLFGWTRLRAAFADGPIQVTPGVTMEYGRTGLTVLSAGGMVVGQGPARGAVGPADHPKPPPRGGSDGV